MMASTFLDLAKATGDIPLTTTMMSLICSSTGSGAQALGSAEFLPHSDLKMMLITFYSSHAA